MVGQTTTSHARLALSFTGQVEIDPAGARLLLLDLANPPGTPLPTDLKPADVRYYRWDNEQLVLDTRDGKEVLSRTMWRGVKSDGRASDRSAPSAEV